MTNSLFTKRRYHNIGNKPDETVESFLKKTRRWLWLTVGLSFLLGIPGIIGFVLFFSSFSDPLPVEVFLLAYCFLIIVIPFVVISMQIFGICRKCSRGLLGRWVITLHGIYHRFGKSPPRFVAWSDVYAVGYNDRKNQIVLETNDVPFVITLWLPEQDRTSVLQFINKLLELLEPFPINTESLLSLQEKERKKLVDNKYCPSSEVIDLLGLIVFLGTAAFSVGLPLVKLIHEYIRSLGVEPEHEIPWFGLVLAWILTPITFVLWRKLKRFHQQKVEKIYQSLLSNKTVENGIKAFPKEFEIPPRTLTAVARRRIRFTWVSMVGMGFALPAMVFVICFTLFDVGTASLFFFFASLGVFLTIYTWITAAKTIRLLEQGVAVRGILHKVTGNKIHVKLFDEYDEITDLIKENTYIQRMVGQSVMAFINPDNRKDAIVFENNVPTAISYDITKNTFDTDSKLPYFLLLVAILFTIEVIVFLYLLIV